MVSRKRGKKTSSSPPSPTSFVDGLQASAQADKEHLLRMEVAAARRDVHHALNLRKTAVQEVEELRQALDAAIGVKEWKPLKVKQRERTSRIHEATAVLLYSDLHPDEVVKPGTVNNLNEFNPTVARERNTALAKAVQWNLEMIREYNGRAGYRIRDCVVGMLGDLISNSIHPELLESNSMSPAEALLFTEQLSAEILDTLLLDDDLETIWVPCCHGNHDRMTPKSRHSTKAGNSLGWIMYHHLAQRYATEPRVKFSIAEGNMIYTDVYGRGIRFTHGDDIRYHGGVGGLTIPMRKAIDSWNQSHHAWLTCCGHWHTWMDSRDFVVNGSLIGYTAFAQAIKARYEPAAQGFFIVDKDYGKGWSKPIQLQGRGEW
jgi:hypothetical protein